MSTTYNGRYVHIHELGVSSLYTLLATTADFHIYHDAARGRLAAVRRSQPS